MDRRSFMMLAGGALLAPKPAFAAAAVDKPVTLTIIRTASDSDVKLMNSVMERFKKKFPSVEVKPQFITSNPWGEYINQLMNLVGSGQTPDIITMPTEGVSTLGSRKLLRNLDDFLNFDPGAKELLADVEANLLTGLSYQGAVNLFPTEWNTVAVYYNTKMFEAAGLDKPSADWDWATFLETAKKLTKTDASGRTTQYGYVVSGKNFSLMPWFLTNGTDRLTPDGTRSNVKDPRFKETLVFLRSLIAEHKVSPTFARNNAGESALISENAAMITTTHSSVPAMISGKADFIDVQVFPKNRTNVSIFGAGGVGVSTASKEPELAWELVKELTGKEFEDELAKNMRATPARRSSATSSPYSDFPPNAKIFYEAAATAKPLIAPPNFAQVEDIMMRHVDAYLTGNVEIDPMIDQLDEELSRAMSRVRW
ncbi:MAG: sugar ABC transporter substrate-binding protein [Rhizobiales bacterium]|nr:sugar ABC transporter substrate-binding protein [Hyphomicrobiales bacterium]OJU30281.1 MAG: hypothetical protein BGN94_04370 [Rhizobiales bacterium 68-8]